jgi:hypothetical protein
MKIQIDSVTVIDDRLDSDGERQIVIEQHGESVLLNADNIQQLLLQIGGRFEEMTCCHVLKPGSKRWTAFVAKYYRK